MPGLLEQLGRGLRFARSRPAEALLVARMAAGVASFSLLLKFLPLPRALSLFSPRKKKSSHTDRSSVSDERIARLLDALLAINVLCFTPTCWKRAAALHRQLALRGRETRVLFGLRREGTDLLAGHAWLESGGEPLFEDAPPRYAVTYSFPS